MAGIVPGLNRALLPFKAAELDFLILDAEPPSVSEDTPRREQAPVAPPPGPHRPAGPGDVVTALPPDRWPASWAGLLAKTPAHPVAVWTYPELADDMAGRGDRSHGNLFRRFLPALGLPCGANAFWPMRDPASVSTEHDGVFFASGVATLQPRVVILLCGSVPPGLGLPPMSPMLPVIHRGVRCVLFQDLPRFTALISTPAGISRAVAYVRNLIGR